jgi:preprotein translocase subunit SecF
MSVEQHEPQERKRLSSEEIDNIKDQIRESIYADFGKSIITKILWIIWAVVLAAFAWLSSKGFIKLGD